MREPIYMPRGIDGMARPYIRECHSGTLTRALAGNVQPQHSMATPVRRVVAMIAGDYDAPCAVCNARPTALLVEWQTGTQVTGLGVPAGDVECSATYEWRFYCPQHEARARRA